MDVTLQVQNMRRSIISGDNTRFRIRPFSGSPLSTTTHFISLAAWCNDYPSSSGFSLEITASADFSGRKGKKLSSGRPKTSAPKGFVPKTSSAPTRKPKQYVSKKDADDRSSDKQVEKAKTMLDEFKTTRKLAQDADDRSSDKQGEKVKKMQDESQTTRKLTVVQTSPPVANGSAGGMKSNGTSLGEARFDDLVGEEEGEDDGGIDKAKEEAFLALKLESEENSRRQEIEVLAEKSFSKGEKMFVYPQVVNPDQEVEVFLNRRLSSLYNEPEILAMGAFNDWKWKSFTVRLSKTHLSEDWWSCRIRVPKEAYKIDFVFFNGGDVYDNNDRKDYCVPVEGGMDEFKFEEFLLAEKQRELKRIAEENAEKERRAEELQRMEAEKAAREADRLQAKTETEKRRELLQKVMTKAVRSVENVWFIEPREFKGLDRVRLFYNRSSGPLAHSKDLWIHGGHDNWSDGLSIVQKLAKFERKDGDWWYANLVVPNGALVLDWVFADGLPQNAAVYDNNRLQDFHAIVPTNIPEDLYWKEEEHKLYRKLQEERRAREAALRVKAEKTRRMKAETKKRTLRRFLLSQKHIFYTEPLDVQAGSDATVFYNPANTVLNGKPEVWFRGSFNRWTHRKGPLPPQKMLLADDGSHVKTTVKVPLDAYMMDFVFSDKEDGGIFDNRDRMDYHVPVFGGIAKESPMNIVHIAVEMAPIAKVGGLGDVVTSLSRAVQDLNHNVNVILPKYDCLKLNDVKDLQFRLSYSSGGTEIKVWLGKVEGVSVYFLEPQNGMFWTGCIYGCRNDGERFGFFCHAALEFLLQSGSHPDIIHCHDWSSAPVAWLFKDHYVHYGLSKTRIIFTIHNLEFGVQNISKAMTYSDKATTVSPTYATEVAGNGAIAPHLYKFHGILNGIDPDIWDPYNDQYIPVHYTFENVIEGKRAAKEALQERLGLKMADLPVVGIITRLTHQKGIHLIKHAIWRTLDRGGQVVLLGSAPDPRIQNEFVGLAKQLHSTHGDRARLCLTYDEPLSHLIYAGSDFILVPSIFEPCGLTQLTAMRYGSIPVVRKTGGLYDTVFDVDDDKERAQSQGLEPNGFNFVGADASGVDYALNRAISAWYDGRDWFNSLCKTVMEQDWSWNKPAFDYMELYHAARK
ncbi:Soluble starch synthase 3, chloroplastic/amyloplastic [Linum perenne]